MRNSSHSLNRVLMVFSNSYDGHYARDLSHGFHEAGVEVGFISLGNALKPNWLERESAKDFSEFLGTNISLKRKILRSISVTRGFKPDVIQTHLFQGGIIGLIVGKLLGIPVVHTRHHIDEHYQSGTALHRLIDRVVARMADHVVVCSEAAKKWLVEIEGVKEAHISVINQGFDFGFLNPSSESIEKAKKDLGFSENNLDIICVSRYSKTKGQDYLLYALSELVETFPNISLTFMGPGDSGWLVELVHELDLEKYVRVLAVRDDVPACIAASDIIVHPSLADSFSQLVIEAQAVGGLLIASDIAAAREQIIDGVTGVIVPPRDSNSIVKAVLHLVRNPDLVSSMKVAAPSHVRESFTWQRMVKEEIECLENYVK